MASPTFVHRFRPLTARELIRLGSHLLSSGTTYQALTKFHERMDEREGWDEGPWVIPLPGDSNDYYVIGEAPEGFELVPVQEQLPLYGRKNNGSKRQGG